MSRLRGKLAQRAIGFLVLLALVAGSVIPAFSQTRRSTRRRAPRLGTYRRPTVAPAPPNYHTVEAGQTLRVRINQELNSANARIGDRFTTTVVDPVYADGVEVIPAGSTVTGRVTSVERAQRRKAGTISVSFVSVQLPNGTSRAINGSLTDLPQNSGGRGDNESTVGGRSTTKRNAVFIGGGAATGALIGAIAGGGKGAGIGAIVGGGLGAAGAVFSKGNEAVVKRDTEFGVSLNQRVSLPAANVR
ncbi:MAG: hypothetical protein QOD00_568 [Blastocatellia bacterium]|jgi:hypothetical protein|nr:hypothetical protein [Blastocatellia bacterium]